MKNKNLETNYNLLYNSSLKDLDKNLSNFIKAKEQEYKTQNLKKEE